MKAVHKILFLVGAIFAVVGMCILIPFSSNIGVFKLMVVIPLIFVVLGICFMLPGMFALYENKKIMRLGKKRPAKITDYSEDTSAVVNGMYPVNTVVHYFDDNGAEREAILETGFSRGSNEYPLGMTVDIYDYNGKISWDRHSVRSEAIPGEAELLDDLPVDATAADIVAIGCKSCGASFCATKGFVSKCPYCGKLINTQ